MRKLRRDILKGRLAPCFQGLEQGGPASEECPICMLQYPALNRSRCCGQGICTECYAQVGEKYRAAAPEKLGGCPFCKTPGYRASYEGCLSAQEVAEREAESREVAEAQERQRLGELERQAEREREVAEMRRNSTEEVPAQEAPGRLPEGAGHSGRAVPVGSRAGAGEGGGAGGGGAFPASPEPGPRLLADDSQVNEVLAQYADFLPPELLSGELSAGGLGVDVEVEELMVHQAILASLRSEGAEGGAGGYCGDIQAALAASAAETPPQPAGPPPVSAPVSLIHADPEGYAAPPAVDEGGDSLRREAAARIIQGRVREIQAARSADGGGGAAEASVSAPAGGEASPAEPLPEPLQETAAEGRVPEPLTAEELDARLMAAMAVGDRQMQGACDAADAAHREAVGEQAGVQEDWRMDGLGAEASGSAESDAPRRRPELDLKISPEQLYHERFGDY